MKKVCIVAMLLLSMGVSFTSCDKNNGLEGTEQTEKENVGVHKIVVTTSGVNTADYTATFSGYNFDRTEFRQIFDKDGKSVNPAYSQIGKVGEEISCYTEDDASELWLSLSIIYAGLEATDITYNIKTYFNGENTKTINKTIKFMGLESNEIAKTIEISTKK